MPVDPIQKQVQFYTLYGTLMLCCYAYIFLRMLKLNLPIFSYTNLWITNDDSSRRLSLARRTDGRSPFFTPLRYCDLFPSKLLWYSDNNDTFYPDILHRLEVRGR